MDVRGNLSLVAIVILVILVMTFQVAFNPPGGVRLAKDKENGIRCEDYNKEMRLCAWKAVLALVFLDLYSQFFLWNTTCFCCIAQCLSLVWIEWSLSTPPLSHVALIHRDECHPHQPHAYLHNLSLNDHPWSCLGLTLLLLMKSLFVFGSDCYHSSDSFSQYE